MIPTYRLTCAVAIASHCQPIIKGLSSGFDSEGMHHQESLIFKIFYLVSLNVDSYSVSLGLPAEPLRAVFGGL